MTEQLECFCDKMGSFDAAGWVCICNQRCYVKSPCPVCGPEGCANGVSRKEAQSLLAGAIGEALAKAGAPELEVDPDTLMEPSHYGKLGHGGIKTRRKS